MIIKHRPCCPHNWWVFRYGPGRQACRTGSGRDASGSHAKLRPMPNGTHDSLSVTDERHDTDWSANLERPEHADDPAVVVEGSKEAIEQTVPGNHVNLVTHGDHGHP